MKLILIFLLFVGVGCSTTQEGIESSSTSESEEASEVEATENESVDGEVSVEDEAVEVGEVNPEDEEAEVESVVEPAADDTGTNVDTVDTSNAEFPAVLDVSAEKLDGTEWDISVTISSQYDSPERYADGWRVLDADGNVLGERVLLHDHANEQPFTRDEFVFIPIEITTVFIEPRDLINGWSGELTEFELPA